MAHIFNVSELTAAIREVVEMHFPFVWVRGQATNVSRPGSGHIYFTLKDEQ
ncbi:exodeoxyribonuclease VII large subunit, partial [Desulfonatronospira sp. MSAO_Bac3]